MIHSDVIVEDQIVETVRLLHVVNMSKLVSIYKPFYQLVCNFILASHEVIEYARSPQSINVLKTHSG